MTRFVLCTLTIATLLMASACSDPAADKSKAVTGTATQPAPATAGKGQKFVFSQDNSKVEFVGSKVTGSHNGSFEKHSGAVDLVNNKPEESQVTVNIQMDSVKTDADNLTTHLKSPDFFDVATYPTATFASTAIKAGGDKGATHTITGNLELHGVKKSISFPATVKVEGDTVLVNSEFAINRKDFGVNYPGKVNDLIRDDVVLKLNIRAEREKK